jgi:anti-sigma B factor antagonist
VTLLLTYAKGPARATFNPSESITLSIWELNMNIKTSTRQVDDVTIVLMKGRIVLGEESASLRDLVRDLLSKGHKKILFNLGDVDYIDSSGLGSLVSALHQCAKARWRIETAAPHQ